jgi:pSer/pThr/pTyr-binding forkhead associated (FHA) protein
VNDGPPGDDAGDERGPGRCVTPDFPAAAPPREVVLRADEVRIGRAGGPSAAAETPEIDLAGPPPDPGVSGLHAVLMALPPDRWVVMDAGSTNGTTLNYDEDPLTPDTPVALRSGDRIHVGAWTTLTVERR